MPTILETGQNLFLIPWLVGAGGFLLTYGGIWLLRRNLRNKLLDIPNERSSHSAPTPRGAGLVVVLVTLVTFIILNRTGAAGEMPWQLAGGAVLIAAVSLVDDWRSLPSWLRFGVHLSGAILAISGLGYFQAVELPGWGTVNLGWLGVPLTVLWIVGLTNIYNFMDGIDGLAGTQALVSGIGWLALGILLERNAFQLFGIIVIVTSLAFLLHNWSPARIFLGDVGSAFWGFLFAVAPLWLEKETGGYFFLPGILMVWIFVFDGVLTICRRAVRGENIFAAHRSHLYQRLVKAGFSHQTVTLWYGMLGLIGSGGIFLSPHTLSGIQIAPGFWLVLGFSAVALWSGTRVAEHLGKRAEAVNPQKPLEKTVNNAD